MINKSGAMAVYLEVGSRSPADVTTCSDIEMMSANTNRAFVRKDGTPYLDPAGCLKARVDGRSPKTARLHFGQTGRFVGGLVRPRKQTRFRSNVTCIDHDTHHDRFCRVRTD